MLLTIFTEGAIFGSGYLIYKGLYASQTYVIEEKSDLYYSLNNNANQLNSNFFRQEQLPVNNEEFSNSILIFIIFLVVMTAIVLFVIYFLMLTKKFSNYIEEIGSGIDELSNGNFETRIDIKNDDELTDIAKNLNMMAVNIKNIMENERKVENTKNELITNVAHDLRTPLTSILGYLDLVSNKNLDEETKSKYVNVALSKSKRLEKMIEDLFAYTKFEFGEVKMHYSEVDVVKMLEQLLDEFYPSFIDNELEQKFMTNVSSVVLWADGDLLARAFANLIGNAIKYGISGKNIIIRIKGMENKVKITVTNFGELIPKNDIDNIFNKFYRVDSSRNEELGGTGLGLAIAKSIVQLHKGTISARSNFEGTVFEVTLPISKEN